MEKLEAGTVSTHSALAPIHATPEVSHDSSPLDILFGSVAGGAGKIIEYPFDTVKVRLQSQPDTRPLQFKGPLDCLRQSLAQEGIIGLYRGISSPIVGAAAENASLFWTYNLAQKYLTPFGYGYMTTSLLSGAISGAFTSYVLTPIELIKCKVQVQYMLEANNAYNRPTIWNMMVNVYRQEGISGFWRGQTGTLLRECGGSAAWFGANEYVKQLFRDASSRDYNTTTEVLLAGSAAGMSYNLSLFPADTIKSRMQTEAELAVAHGQPTTRSTFLSTARAIVRSGGISALYRGCGITVCRSAPSSAIIFLTYEKLKELFDHP
uniref:ARAD1D14916p n=1 Tax=Blastobotrys adeninivorans TaxID=409370 RepID=A0A060T8Z6_BLAAD